MQYVYRYYTLHVRLINVISLPEAQLHNKNKSHILLLWSFTSLNPSWKLGYVTTTFQSKPLVSLLLHSNLRYTDIVLVCSKLPIIPVTSPCSPLLTLDTEKTRYVEQITTCDLTVQKEIQDHSRHRPPSSLWTHGSELLLKVINDW